MKTRKSKPQLRLEYRKASELKANPRNWRKHPRSQKKALEAVIAEVGWAGVLLYNERTERLIDGHLRKDISGNGDKVPVLIGSWTDEQERIILATLDPIAAMAEADKDELAGLLEAVESQDEGIQALLDEVAQDNRIQRPVGAQAEDPGAQIDKAEELQAKWKVERGQIWQVGKHRVMCGDSTSQEDVARLMGGELIDLLFTSPPYASGKNVGYKSDYYGERQKFYTHDLDEMTPDEWFAMCNKCLNRLAGVMRSPESPALLNLMYNSNNRRGYGRLMFRGDHPFRVHETICWDKSRGFPTANKGILSRNWELIFVLSCGDVYFSTQARHGVRWAKWDILGPQKQSESLAACFPVELAERALTDFSADNSSVCDPFLGSGTTLVACEQLNRIGYGMEIEPKYVAATLERLSGMGLKPKAVA